MFGYLRPMQGELKVSELERYKACYCGLCRTIGRKYGNIARFLLSYELVLLSMLLWDKDEKLAISSGRCMASPIRKKRFCTSNKALDVCAAYNVILSWWKLRDSINDSSFFKALPLRAFSLLLRRAYKKASREFAGFDATVKMRLSELASYEKGTAASLDGAADKFAAILSSIAETSEKASKSRPLGEMLYHLGRWIYIIDACDDYENDIAENRYNPVAAKFPPESGKLPDDGKARIDITLSHSNNLVCSAFELLPENVWTQTIRNTIYLGMPYVCERVMEGAWPPSPNYRQGKSDL